MDYQHPETSLQFSRFQPAPTERENNAGSRAADIPWRHQYEIVLTHQNNNRIIFDEVGNRHVFVRQQDGQYAPLDESSGTLVYVGDRPLWTTQQGTRHRFRGSLLTSIQHPRGDRLTLRYQQGRLSTITDNSGNALTLNYPEGELSQIVTPDGQVRAFPTSGCVRDTEPEADTCDVSENPIAHFDSDVIRADSWFLDARPASCQSYFTEYFGTERGSELETGLQQLPPYAHMAPTVRSFPIVDFINGNELIVIRSRDLASPSFNDASNPNALLYRLLRDGQAIQSDLLDPLEHTGAITWAEQGQETHLQWHADQIVTLHLIIRHQFATQSHWQQISEARDTLLTRYGIKLEVVLVP